MNSTQLTPLASDSKVKLSNGKPVAAHSSRPPVADPMYRDPSAASGAGRYPVPVSMEDRYAVRGRH
ncbi:hypothetical protein V9K67_14745 [Paraflavisolibacter sp. H34]|uniref:hypothetical protein n=1 Tax=Huijunlia imazamoxiresistens TaxID=3127457 RepID=UPI0030174879